MSKELKQVTENPPLPLSYSAMLNGQYAEALERIMEKEGEFGLFIKALSLDLEDNKRHADVIRNRSFFEKLFSSNTKDFADLIYQQNTTLSAMFIIMQMQTYSGEDCQKLLANLYKYAQKQSNTIGSENKTIEKSFIRIIKANAQQQRLNEIRDQALMKLLKAAENNKNFELDMRTSVQEAIDKCNREINEIKSEYSRAHEQLSSQIESHILYLKKIILSLLIGIGTIAISSLILTIFF